MNVNINSWHFKLWAFAFNKNINYSSRPKSLCTYFWSVVLSILYAPLLLAFNYILGGFSTLFFTTVDKTGLLYINCDITDREDRKEGAWYFILILIIGSLLFNLINMLVLGYGWKFWEYIEMLSKYPQLPFFFKISNMLSTIFSIILLIIGTVISIVYFFTESEAFSNILNSIKKFFTKSMLGEYIKAIKNKTCPIIEYSDEQIPNQNN